MQDKWLNRQGAQEQEGDAIGLRGFPLQRGTVQWLPPRHHLDHHYLLCKLEVGRRRRQQGYSICYSDRQDQLKICSHL